MTSPRQPRLKQESETIPKQPVKLKGIKVSGVSFKAGKITKKDTAPPHVRAGRRRKAGKVTGVRAAK